MTVRATRLANAAFVVTILFYGNFESRGERKTIDSSMSGMERFKEALFAAVRSALSRAHDRSPNSDQSLGEFWLGQTDELIAAPTQRVANDCFASSGMLQNNL
jgi:hypothetical protein